MNIWIVLLITDNNGQSSVGIEGVFDSEQKANLQMQSLIDSGKWQNHDLRIIPQTLQ